MLGVQLAGAKTPLFRHPAASNRCVRKCAWAAPRQAPIGGRSQPVAYPQLTKSSFGWTKPQQRRAPFEKRAGLAPQAGADGASVQPSSTPEEEKSGFLGISNETWQKVIPLGFMFFCILFNYTILRDTKDVLVVTAPGSGAEIIPFLKTWVNLPLAIGFTVLYAKLANVLTAAQLFYCCLIPFVAFFGSFAFVLYPLRDVLHPTEFCVWLLSVAGERFAGPIAILRNWTFCLFYVMAELWGSVVVSVLFWGFANSVTTVDEAKQFYPLFGLGANLALIVSGRAVVLFSDIRSKLPPGVDGWAISLRGMMGLVVIGGALIGLTYWYMQKTVVVKQQAKLTASQPADAPKKKKKKMKMSVGESFRFLASSSYIRDLATLVVAYGISINLVEVTWKSKLKAQFPNPNDYSSFMGNFSTATGIVTFTMMLVSKFIFKRFGWGVAALITPTVLLATGLAFFGLLLFGGVLEPVTAGLGLTALMAAVLVGAAQNVFSKSSKYSLFDPCKEMAYIPLEEEVRTKGKAAIDVICNPLGKSGGALIQQVMIIGFGSLAASTPYLGLILFVIVGLWIRSAISLNGQFEAAEAKQQLERIKAARLEDAKQGVHVEEYTYKVVNTPSEDRTSVVQKVVRVEDHHTVKEGEEVRKMTEQQAEDFNQGKIQAKADK